MAVSLQCVRVEPVYAFGVEYMSAHQPSNAFSTFERRLADAARVVAAVIVNGNIWMIRCAKTLRRCIQIRETVQFDIGTVTIPNLAVG